VTVGRLSKEVLERILGTFAEPRCAVDPHLRDNAVLRHQHRECEHDEKEQPDHQLSV